MKRFIFKQLALLLTLVMLLSSIGMTEEAITDQIVDPSMESTSMDFIARGGNRHYKVNNTILL